MAWRCGKCDGAIDVLVHSPYCPKRDEDQGVSVVDWSTVHQLQRRPDPRADDACPGTAH